MSTKETELADEVESLLKNFPLGKTEDEVQEEFPDFEDKEVTQALEALEQEGTVLNTGGSYRWTG